MSCSPTSARSGAGDDAEPLHLGGGRRPDAMEFLHRQIGDEARPGLRGDDRLPIRLVQVARHLREELAIGNAGRGIETGDLLDAGSDDRCDLGRDRNAPLVLGDVEIGLVQGQRLDQVGMLGEDFTDL